VMLVVLTVMKRLVVTVNSTMAMVDNTFVTIAEKISSSRGKAR